MEKIGTVLAIAAWLQLNIFQLDVKSAILNGELEEEIYISSLKARVYCSWKGEESLSTP